MCSLHSDYCVFYCNNFAQQPNSVIKCTQSNYVDKCMVEQKNFHNCICQIKSDFSESVQQLIFFGLNSENLVFICTNRIFSRRKFRTVLLLYIGLPQKDILLVKKIHFLSVQSFSVEVNEDAA